MHLRLLTRVHAIAAFVICSLLTFAWIYPSLHVTSQFAKSLTGSSRRIIVFGDSFSDTGAYIVPPLSEDLRHIRDVAEGQRWTEILCEEYLCDSVDNFARSFQSPSTTYSGGAVLGNEIYSNTTSRNESVPLNLLPDLKNQVEQWVAYEQQIGKSAEDDEPDEVIFTISFGFYDIWQYATLEIKEAQDAISCSIYELFQQLDIIAEQSSTPPRILMPLLWDITFHPWFVSLSQNQNHGTNHYGEQQHKMIYLVKYWNSAILQMAGRWPRGDLFLLDWNNWVVAQIRTTQMHELNIYNSSDGVGTEKPVFRDVSNACLVVSPPNEKVNGSGSRCTDPSQNLFWDGTQFGPTAHRMLGKEAARAISTNDTANAQIRRKSTPTDGDGGNQLVRIHLIPSLAPGN